MIAIIKYNAGNITSVQHALNRLGYKSIVTDDINEIQSASKVIFPGVGEASTAMDYLRKRELDTVIKQLSQPVLGICLGMQLMCNYSEENNTKCLGIFDTYVKLFPSNYIVPHMGWNNIFDLKNEIFNNLTVNNDVYFVHSYYAEITTETIATCDYILPFSAAIKKNNFYATQFHTEKSGIIGLEILNNFLKL